MKTVYLEENYVPQTIKCPVLENEVKVTKI